jgi:hypothetical protein
LAAVALIGEMRDEAGAEKVKARDHHSRAFWYGVEIV